MPLILTSIIYNYGCAIIAIMITYRDINSDFVLSSYGNNGKSPFTAVYRLEGYTWEHFSTTCSSATFTNYP